MKSLFFLQSKLNKSITSQVQWNPFFIAVLMLFSCSLYSQQQTFNYTGAEQSWTVPAGVTSVEIIAYGAQGGGGALGSDGALGGYAKGDLAVTPGQTLYVYVGGKGEMVSGTSLAGGGFNGGGNARGGETQYRGGGGGATDVRAGGNGLDNRVIVAGGGGGACSPAGMGGVGGGNEGAPGQGSSGSGGSQTAGGTTTACDNGGFGFGGSSSLNALCAGGGGGYYGGAAGCGPGGGSGYIGGVTNGTMLLGIRTGAGRIFISYTQEIPFPNDDCPDPIEVFCDDIITASTVGAEPDYPACSGFSNTGGGLWYTFTGQGENISVSTCRPGTDFDTHISVFTGDCNEPICVASNDNAPGCGLQSHLTFFAASGGQYRILINGLNGAEGNFELTVFCGCPSFTVSCPENLNLECGQSVPPAATSISAFEQLGGTINGGGLCFPDAFTISHQDVSFSCHSAAGVHTTRTYTIENTFNDEIETCTQNFLCPIPPPLEVTCPANILLECHESIPPIANNAFEWMAQGGAVAGGICDPIIYGSDYVFLHTETTNQAGFCSTLTLYRTYTIIALDTGQSMTCSHTIKRLPAPAPTIASNGPAFIECHNDLLDMDLESLVTVTHPNPGCDPFYSISHSALPAPDFASCSGNQFTIEFEVTDECGRTNTTEQLFTVANDGLEIICPEDEMVLCFDQIIYSANDVSVSHACGLDYDLNVSTPQLVSGVEGQAGAVYGVEYTAENSCGESVTCEKLFTAQNGNDLVIVCAPDRTVACFADVIAEPGLVEVITPCGENNSLTFGDPVLIQGNGNCSGSTYSMTYDVATDSGLSGSCTQIFTIENDGTEVMMISDGIVECAADIDVSINDIEIITPCDLLLDLVFTGPVIDDPAHPNCSGNTYTYNYAFTDECGVDHSYDRIFTIQNDGTEVTIAPDEVVECAEDIIIDESSIQITAPCNEIIEVEFTGPEIADPAHPNCSGNTHTYNFAFTDECGVAHSYDRVFTIQNDPVQLVKVDPYLLNIENNSLTQIQCYGQDDNWNVPTFDESAVSAIASCNNEYTITYQFNDLEAADCQADGYLHRYEYVWTVEDECGTTDQFSFQLEIVDNIPPTITGVPADVTVECTAAFPDMPEVVAIDECLCAYISVEEEELTSITCSGYKTIVRTWTAWDHCGNTTEAKQHIYVEDQTAPEVSFNGNYNGEITNGSELTATCDASDYPNWIFDLDENSIDIYEACSENTITTFSLESDISYHCQTSGYLENYTPSWTVTDDCGNVSTFSFNLKVIDNTAPTFYNSEVLYLCDGFEEGYAVAIDNCSGEEMDYEDSPIEDCGSGMYTRTYFAIDDCGNESTLEQLVVDLSQNPQLITLAAPLDFSELVYQCELNNDNYSGMSASDAVPVMECMTDLDITFSETVLPNSCEDGGSKLQLLWTATSPCGYVETMEYLVDLVDNEAPYFPDFQEELELNCGEPMPAVIALDDCNEVSIAIEENASGATDCVNGNAIVRTITATDLCGNATNVTQVLHFTDTAGPVFDLPTSVCEGEDSNESVYAFDDCSGGFIEATLISEEVINECAEYPVIQEIWTAEDNCGNLTEFSQLVYPLDYELEYDVIEEELSTLIDYGNFVNDAFKLRKSNAEQMTMLESINEFSVIAYDPCGDVVTGILSEEITIHEDCKGGIGATQNYTWVFADVCGTVYGYTLSFDILYDIPPVIEVEEVLNIYCTTVLPELLFTEEESVEYEIEVNDQRDENGDGIVTRIITGTDPCGNVSTAIQAINAYNTSDLQCSIEGDFQPDCNSHNNVYTVDPTGGTAPYTINWSVEGSGCIIEQVYGNTAEISIGFGLANIMVEVIDANGCVTYCEAKVSCRGTGGLTAPEENNVAFEEAFIKFENTDKVEELVAAAYPNPFTDRLTVTLESGVEENYVIRVLNNLGKQVHSARMNNSKATLNLSTLPSGIYYVVVEGKTSMKSLRILKTD